MTLPLPDDHPTAWAWALVVGIVALYAVSCAVCDVSDRVAEWEAAGEGDGVLYAY